MRLTLPTKMKLMLRSESRLAEIFRFLITGLVAMLIQYGFYLIFIISHLKPVLSTLSSYLISFIANFILSNFFTFHTHPDKKKAILFTVSHCINLTVQTGLVAFFSRHINSEYALIPAMLICIPINYILVRYALRNKCFPR